MCHGGQHNAVLLVGGADADLLEEVREIGRSHESSKSGRVGEETATVGAGTSLKGSRS